MKRWNITLPDDISHELAAVRNKSRFIAETLAEKLKAMKKQKLDQLLVEGYQRNKKESKKINDEWEPISLHDWEW